MTQVIVYETVDGAVGLLAPPPQTQLPGETEQAWLGRIRLSVLGPDVPFQVVDASSLPPGRASWQWDNGVTIDPAMLKADLVAYAATMRWAREVGGCVIDGHQVATDRDSQSKYLAEFVAISAGMRADPSSWKFANGEFAMLSNAAMAAVIMGVRAHVAGAFATEMTVLAGIAGGTITTTAQIDAAF